MSNELQNALKQYFGFDSFRPGQQEAMREIMRGRDCLVVMPTGAGKSLCFQLPALLQEGTTLVISPLIALMKDQVDSLQQLGLPATFINSSLDAAEQRFRLQKLREGHWKLCYVAPERLRNQTFRDTVKQAKVSFLAVDEAHCISQWGHDFRPDYRALGEFAELLGRPPIAALTATATEQVQGDIVQQLHLNDPFLKVTGFNRPNLRFDQHFTPSDAEKLQVIKQFLSQQEANTCGIIYVGRRRESEQIASFIRSDCKQSAVSYHGGMEPHDRQRAQDKWMSDGANIVVATNAFGMGVDKPNVRFVIHYTMPGTLEAYYQEAGRAGRDGETSYCLLLSDPSDIRLHEWFIDNSAPSIQEMRILYGTVQRMSRRSGGLLSMRANYLADKLKWRSDNKVRVAMKILEQAGLLEDLGERNGVGRWQMLQVRGKVDMNGPMQEVEERQQQKRKLLQIMMEFTQTYDCRRQYLLDYFGDPAPPVAEWCCDNCQRQDQNADLGQASSPQELALLAIFDTITHIPYGVGRALLAKILTGSRAKGMNRYFEHPQFSTLSYMKRKAVQGLIDELIRQRYLKISSGKYPTVSLSAAGEKAARERLGIPINYKAELKPSSVQGMRRVASQRVTDTVDETRQLLVQGMGAQEIADVRGLKIGTIFNHLASLIEQEKIAVEDVVDEQERQLIEAAVQEVGSFYLSPIKARLPEEVSYGEIRCVVAWMQKQEQLAVEPLSQQNVLMERLREWRTKRAQETGIRSHIIFSNAVLHAIAEAMPRSLDGLLAVRGVSQDKCQQYGAEILAIVSNATGKAILREARESYVTTPSQSDHSSSISKPTTKY